MTLSKQSFSQTLLLLVLLLSLPVVAGAQTVKVKVVGVVDGDTITVLTKDKSQKQIRLLALDAPEKEQQSGDAAREKLIALVLGKKVAVESSKIDADGQILGKVLLDGNDVGLEIIRAGFAWYDKESENGIGTGDKAHYLAAEIEAREKAQGLWREQAPLTPWEFRKQHKSEARHQAPNQGPASVFSGRILTGNVAEVVSNIGIALRMPDNSRTVVCVGNLETPEPGQPFADAAKQHLKDLLLNRNVKIILKGFGEDDNCLLADVYLDHININLQMVRDGVAWSNKDYFYPEGYYVFEQAEQAARSERRGIWQDPTPTPPWIFRGDGTTVSRGSGSGGFGSGGSGAGRDVQVRGYYRTDGTYVRSHTRSAPGRASGGSGTKSSTSGRRRN